MKIAMLSSAAAGGAGIAAKRLCDALNLLEGVTCHFIDISLLGEVPVGVVYKGSASNRTISDTHFTGEHTGFMRQWVIDLLIPYEIINVQWASFLVTTAEILALAKAGKRVVITMHDFYYSTGGCHYQAGCEKQTEECRRCPQVDEQRFSRFAVQKSFQEKKELLMHNNVLITAPSEHVISRVLGVGLSNETRVRTIRNVFAPHALQNTLPVKDDAKIRRILVIADSLGERRKGIETAVNAVRLAAQQHPGELELHVVGGTSDALEELSRKNDLPVHFHGHIFEIEKLAEIYRQCDLLLTCSTEDNWPNILVEACSFGMTPVVGPGHGCEEFVKAYRNGHVSKSYAPKDFAAEITVASRTLGHRDAEQSSIREKVIYDHSAQKIADTFVNLFEREVLN